MSIWMLVYIGLRSFFLQTVWNFERMQNVGFAFTIMPALKKLYPAKKDYGAAIQRHLDFFNVHPYMVGIIVGLVLRQEERMARAGVIDAKKINSLKNVLAGPLAAIGDAFFWGLWRPFIALIAILFFYLFPHPIWTPTYCAYIVFTFLILYNIPHIAIRFWGIFKAYSIDTDVIMYVKQWHELDIQRYIRNIATLFLGIAFLAFIVTQGYRSAIIVKSVCLFIVFVALNRRKFSATQIIMAMLVILCILSYAKVLS